MDPITIYSVSAGALLLAALLSSCFFQSIKSHLLLFVKCQNFLCLPLIYTRLRFLSIAISTALLYVLYCGGNIACIVYQVSSWEEAGLRSATLAVVNLVFLLSAIPLDLLSNLFNISLRCNIFAHRLVSNVVYCQSAFHLAIALSRQRFQSNNPEQVTGLVVCVSLSIKVYAKESLGSYTSSYGFRSLRLLYLLFLDISQAPLRIILCTNLLYLAPHTEVNNQSQNYIGSGNQSGCFAVDPGAISGSKYTD